LLVELTLDGVRVHDALEAARFAAEGVEVGDAALAPRPLIPRKGDEARVQAAGHDDAALEGRPELRREREAVLVVDGVVVGAEEHSGAGSVPSTLPHSNPLNPTCPPSAPLASRAAPRVGSGSAASRF